MRCTLADTLGIVSLVALGVVECGAGVWEEVSGEQRCWTLSSCCYWSHLPVVPIDHRITRRCCVCVMAPMNREEPVNYNINRRGHGNNKFLTQGLSILHTVTTDTTITRYTNTLSYTQTHITALLWIIMAGVLFNTSLIQHAGWSTIVHSSMVFQLWPEQEAWKRRRGRWGCVKKRGRRRGKQ